MNPVFSCVLPDTANAAMAERCRNALRQAGAKLVGEVEIKNGIYCFAPIQNPAGGISSFVGVVSSDKQGALSLAGALEYHLDDTSAIYMGKASAAYVSRLSGNFEYTNQLFRAQSLSNSMSLGRGVCLYSDAGVPFRGDVINRLVVINGQKGVAVAADDFQSVMPDSNGALIWSSRAFKDSCRVDGDFFNINQLSVARGRAARLATELVLSDTAIVNDNGRFDAFISGMMALSRDSEMLLVFYGGDYKGAISGTHIDLAIGLMSEHNARNGFNPIVLHKVVPHSIVIGAESEVLVQGRRDIDIAFNL